MKSIFAKTWSRFKSDERGVTLVEYAIALVLAVTVGAGALTALSGGVTGKMNGATTTLGGTPST